METIQKRFLIGFDRYVQLDWCTAALDVAIGKKSLAEIGVGIAEVLPGSESRRKTLDILKRLWLQPLPQCTDFVRRGVDLYRQFGDDLVIPLNWGCAMATYPFFGMTSEITGRLLAIQGGCSIKEVQRRMAEVYGDRDSVTSAVSRVLQSQESWGAIERVDKGKRLNRRASMTLSNDQTVAWLVEAVLRYTGKAVSVTTLQSMPVIYPFVLDQPLAYVVSISPHLELRSEGSSNQFVSLSEAV